MFLKEDNRIALISANADPTADIAKEDAGCQNVYVRQVGLALAAQGWKVDLFARRTSLDGAEIVEHGSNCRTIRLMAGPTKVLGRDEIFGYMPEFLKAFQAFEQQEGLHYSLIHTNYWLSGWVGMELKKRRPLIQVHTYHSLGASNYRGTSEIQNPMRMRLAIEKACLEMADRAIATSPQEEEYTRSLLGSKGEIEMIPCGTDIDRFGAISRAEARAKLGIPKEAKVVLHVGRFDRRKGIETLVRAVSRSEWRSGSDLRLISASGFPSESERTERDRIAGIARELGLSERVTFASGVVRDELPLYYAAADVCAVPSQLECFGMVAIEAMANRTPVVASDLGGLRFTVVPEVTGLLAPPHDEGAFAKAIDRILGNPDWRDELGRQGRHRVEIAFSWYSVASRLGVLYTKLLSQFASVAPREAKAAA